jgi:hypothetical protein
MQPTIWTVLIVATMLLNTVVSRSQTRGPSTLRAAVNATDGAEIDALYAPRPPMLRMWTYEIIVVSAHGSRSQQLINVLH